MPALETLGSPWQVRERRRRGELGEARLAASLRVMTLTVPEIIRSSGSSIKSAAAAERRTCAAWVGAASRGYRPLIEQPICECGQPLVWLVAERWASDLLSRQLWRCTACERFTWHFEHPPWSNEEGILRLPLFIEFLREQQAEIAQDAYCRQEPTAG